MTIDDYYGHEGSRAAFVKYRRDGFALFPKLFSDAEVDDLKMRAMLARGHDRLRQEQRGAQGTIVFWSAAVDPALDALRSSRRLFDIVAEALGTTDIRQHSQHLCYRDPGNADATRWHRDEIALAPRVADPRRASVAVALYLDDVLSVDEGAMLFVPGSHDWTVEAWLETEAYEHLEAMLPRRGMVGLWNAGTIHGSRPNVTQHDRRSVLHGYVRADAAGHGEDIWAWKDGEGVRYPKDSIPA